MSGDLPRALQDLIVRFKKLNNNISRLKLLHKNMSIITFYVLLY